MTRLEYLNAMVSNDFDEDSGEDTDEELKEAFAAGLLKPGLNVIGEMPTKSQPKNNTAALKAKLKDIKASLPWVERLNLVNGPAPMAPELALQEQEHEKEREAQLKRSKVKMSVDDDLVHNDFKREMLFYRQAQAAVLEAIPRLQSMGIPTRRPDDYFAQMAKSDDHMQKIREKLLSKQQVEERREKIKKLREQKKFGKKVQVEVEQRRMKEKKAMLEEVKKFRKGKVANLDFLEDGGGGGGPPQQGKQPNKKGSAAKRESKEKKFGYGGKKKGAKRNTKESADDISDYKPFRRPGAGGGGKFGKKGGKGGAVKRPGKDKRQKMKFKNKNKKNG